MKERILSFLTVFALCFSLICVPALAAGEAATVEGIYDNGVVTVTGSGFLPGMHYSLIQIHDNGAFKTMSGATADVQGDLTVDINLGTVADLDGYTVTVCEDSTGNAIATGPIKEKVNLYSVTITVNKDGGPWTGHGKTFTLKATDGTTVSDLDRVPDGTYTIMDGSMDTGVTVTVNGAAYSATLDYYTVSFDATKAGTATSATVTANYGGSGISSGDVVPGGKKLVLTASGSGAGSYTYVWSGKGASGETTQTLTVNSLAAAIDVSCAVTGSGVEEPPAPTTCTVTFDSQGGSDIESVDVKKGEKVSKPAADPTREGYIFDGWYTNADCTTAWNFDDAVTGNLTLYAKWTKVVPATGVTLDKTTLSLKVGSTAQLTATVEPSDSTDKPVWKSNDESVATVDETGKVTAVSTGTVTITVTAGEQTASCTVAVSAVDDDHGGSSGTGSGGGTGFWGGNNASSTSRVSINSGTHGKITASTTTPKKGDIVTLTIRPDDGYELDTLTVTSGGEEIDVDIDGNKATFEMPGTSVTIKATFRTASSEPGSGDEPGNEPGDDTALPFTDVTDDFWAHDQIAWAYQNGYMNGYSATSFNPSGTVTRQQLWMVLARISGENPSDMAAARDWAMSNNVSDGSNPGNPVSRQQMVTMLYRYAQLNNYNTAGGTSLSSYPDNGTVQSYATDALSWAVGNGIVNGTNDGRLDPEGTAIRSQFAVILYRFCNTIVK